MVMSTIYPIRQRRTPGLFESVKINGQWKSVASKNYTSSSSLKFQIPTISWCQ
jgi:hypothetical protein